jgi:hypothetical protein
MLGLPDLARDEWNLGIVHQTISDIVRRGIVLPIRWFPGNSWRIFADPFCFRGEDGTVTILAEMLNHWNGRGEIWSAIVEAGDDPLNAKFRPHIRSSAHLSYPSYIREGDTTFATMESFEVGELFLWRLNGSQWRFEKTLLARPAIDPTIYHDGELWWLFCTFADDRPDENLHLFYAKSLLEEWVPHPSNPIVSNRANARPAGELFQVDGMLIRPAQDSSITYGGRLILNRVITLTPDTFNEVPFRTITPQSDYYADGVHTISAAGDYTIIDGKRWHRGFGNVGRRITAKALKMYRMTVLRRIPLRFQFNMSDGSRNVT